MKQLLQYVKRLLFYLNICKERPLLYLVLYKISYELNLNDQYLKTIGSKYFTPAQASLILYFYVIADIKCAFAGKTLYEKVLYIIFSFDKNDHNFPAVTSITCS